MRAHAYSGPSGMHDGRVNCWLEPHYHEFVTVNPIRGARLELAGPQSDDE